MDLVTDERAQATIDELVPGQGSFALELLRDNEGLEVDTLLLSTLPNVPDDADFIVIGNAQSRGNPEVEAVLAHELGHFKLHHVLKLTAMFAVLGFAFFWLLGLAAEMVYLFGVGGSVRFQKLVMGERLLAEQESWAESADVLDAQLMNAHITGAWNEAGCGEQSPAWAGGSAPNGPDPGRPECRGRAPRLHLRRPQDRRDRQCKHPQFSDAELHVFFGEAGQGDIVGSRLNELPLREPGGTVECLSMI